IPNFHSPAFNPQHMKYRHLSLCLLLLFALAGCQSECPKCPEAPPATDTPKAHENPHTVTFPSADSLPITANVYQASETAPIIVLCHQARFNKSEYNGIAERLNDMGFTCIAIDQRSGGPIASHQNETWLAAKAAGKGTDFLDAEQDIRAAVDHISAQHDGAEVILWGSSYSSTLVLYVAADHPKVRAVMSFSPGNYFAEDKGDLPEILKDFEKPMFITCGKREAEQAKGVYGDKTLNENQELFVPEGAGHHGSRALWPNQDGGEEYWAAVTAFLKKL
ncbi:MAG: alpha/beta fold hydrolase, partial [Bacteroidota bacterium]